MNTTNNQQSATNPTPADICDLLRQLISEGDHFVLVECGGFTQVGLQPQAGRIRNITAAVGIAFALPHKGLCIQATREEVQKHLDTLTTQPAPQPAAQPITSKSLTNKVNNAELIAALNGLGYSAAEAKQTVSLIPADAPQDFESRLLLALQYGAR